MSAIFISTLENEKSHLIKDNKGTVSFVNCNTSPFWPQIMTISNSIENTYIRSNSSS